MVRRAIAAGHRQRGFSLVELVTVVAIIGILIALGLPSFTDSIRANRVSTGVNDVLAALMLARSEAIKSSRTATVCSSADASAAVPACGGDWNDGWIVWIDRDRNGAVSNAGEVLRAEVGDPDLNVVGGAPAGVASISFDARGRRVAPGGTGDARLDLASAVCPAGKRLLRHLYVSSAGRPRISDQNLTATGYAVCP